MLKSHCLIGTVDTIMLWMLNAMIHVIVIVYPQGIGRDCKARRESSSGGGHSKTVSNLHRNWRRKVVVPIQRKVSFSIIHFIILYFETVIKFTYQLFFVALWRKNYCLPVLSTLVLQIIGNRFTTTLNSKEYSCILQYIWRSARSKDSLFVVLYL